MDVRMQKQSAKSFGEDTSGQSSVPKPQNDADADTDAEFWPLSGKPYFHVVIGKKKFFQMPHKIAEILPKAEIPVKIVHRGKVWDFRYLGDQPIKRFASEEWGKFVTDNKLVVDDACVFELMEVGSSASCYKFKVQILRNDFPSELLEKAEGTRNNPIVF